MWKEDIHQIPETKKDIPKRKEVELPYIQEARELSKATSRLNAIKEKQQNNIHTSWEKKIASDELTKSTLSFDMWPGKLSDNWSTSKENFVESPHIKDQKELAKATGEYQIQLTKTYNTHMRDLVWKPEEQKKLWSQYLEWCIWDLKMNSKNIWKENIAILSQSLPEVWKNTILHPESAQSPLLKQVRNSIITDCMKYPRKPWSTDEQFQKELLDHIKKTTGIDSLTQNDIRSLQFNEKEKLMEQKQPNETDIEYNSRHIDSAETNGTGEATLSEKGVTDGDTAWYSPETGKSISENAAKTAEKIKEVFKDKPELHKFIDRHASNNPNFSLQKPFLMQNLSIQKAFIYYPGAETFVECSATHWVRGISNTDKSHGTSLGSKELVPDTNDDRGNKIKIRTAVKGLESCNSNDFSRDIRIHEQHGSKTWWCTGLPMSDMEKFDAAIDAAWGGAMEIFMG